MRQRVVIQRRAAALNAAARTRILRGMTPRILRVVLLGVFCLACTGGTFTCKSDDDKNEVIVNTK